MSETNSVVRMFIKGASSFTICRHNAMSFSIASLLIINVQSQCMGIVLRYIQQPGGGGIVSRIFRCKVGICGQESSRQVPQLGCEWPIIPYTYVHNQAR